VPVIVFAGPGNNGGDALAVARMLGDQGYQVTVYLFNINGHLSEECAANKKRLVESKRAKAFTEVTQEFDPPRLEKGMLVVDGLFGSGLNKPLAGGFASLVKYINASQADVVAIDVPSGLMTEDNTYNVRANIIRASVTLTLQQPKLAFFFPENQTFIGQLRVLDIRLSQEGIEKTEANYTVVEESEIRSMLLGRDPFAHKGQMGHALLIAGSYGMMGAAVLAARGALRTGAGLVTVHAPRCGYQVLQTAVPEALFEPDRNELMTESIDLRHTYSVVALGPGMGVHDETLEAVHHFIMNFKRPCLIDADALNCIAHRPMLLKSIPQRSIITPHAIEFDRLFGEHNTDEERLKKAIDVSKLYSITIVLKGHYTMTVRPDSKVYVNSSGNPGMATPGSGDVLTGVIASLIAQNYSPDWSVVLGVYLHGLAGDLAAQVHGTYGMVASDIVDNLGKAIIEVMK
jgi:NAD(P)H-hydrate epimerase